MAADSTLYNLATGALYVLGSPLPDVRPRTWTPAVGQHFTARLVANGWALITLPCETGEAPGIHLAESHPLFGPLIARLKEEKPSLSSVVYGRGLTSLQALRALDLGIARGELQLGPLANALDTAQALKRAPVQEAHPTGWDADGREAE